MPIHINPTANHPSNNSKEVAAVASTKSEKTSVENVAKNGSNNPHLVTGEQNVLVVHS